VQRLIIAFYSLRSLLLRELCERFFLSRSSNQHRNQLGVRRWKLQLQQRVAGDPLHRLAELRLRFATQLALEEMQFDHALWIRVRDAVDLRTDARVRAELLDELASQARVERFAGVALAARKLPIAFQMRPSQTPGDKEPSLALDDRGGDDDVS